MPDPRILRTTFNGTTLPPDASVKPGEYDIVLAVQNPGTRTVPVRFMLQSPTGLRDETSTTANLQPVQPGTLRAFHRIQPGEHVLHLQAADDNDAWHTVATQRFTVRGASDPGTAIGTRAQHFTPQALLATITNLEASPAGVPRYTPVPVKGTYNAATGRIILRATVRSDALNQYRFGLRPADTTFGPSLTDSGTQTVPAGATAQFVWQADLRNSGDYVAWLEYKHPSGQWIALTNWQFTVNIAGTEAPLAITRILSGGKLARCGGSLETAGGAVNVQITNHSDADRFVTVVIEPWPASPTPGRQNSALVPKGAYADIPVDGIAFPGTVRVTAKDNLGGSAAPCLLTLREPVAPGEPPEPPTPGHGDSGSGTDSGAADNNTVVAIGIAAVLLTAIGVGAFLLTRPKEAA